MSKARIVPTQDAWGTHGGATLTAQGVVLARQDDSVTTVTFCGCRGIAVQAGPYFSLTGIHNC